MTDNQLLALLIQTLNAGLATWPFVGSFGPISVLQKNQPVKQGTPSGPSLYVEKLFDHVYGSPAVMYEANPAPNTIKEIEDQVYTSTFQFTALVKQDPRDVSRPTASDLCSVARVILQRRATLRQFALADIGVLRVTDVRNDYFNDDQDRQEAGPTFDLVVTYKRTAPAVVIDTITRVDTFIYQVP